MSNEIPAEALRSIRESFDGTIHIDDVTRIMYATDASAYQETPLAVAIPKTEADIRLLIEFANQFGIGLIPRTAGTSLAGQVVGSGIVVDVSRHFTQILEINPDEHWVRVQPGVIRDELNQAMKPHGLMFGPETSTANRAMLGGMLGNNSCGSNSIVFGSTRDHVLEVRGFLSNGSETTFRELSDTEFAAKCDSTTASLETSLYREFRDLLSDPFTRAEIEREFPKPEINRRNTGYAIDLLMDASPLATLEKPSDKRFNFCKLIAGSEGTLFFATELKLRCVPLPLPASGLMCVHFDSVDKALRATQIVMKHRLHACELIDQFVLEGAVRNIEQRENASFVEGLPAAILLIEVRGETPKDVVVETGLIEQELRTAALGYHFPVLFDEDIRKVWELRKSGLGSIANVPGDAKPVAVIEDTAVAVDDLPNYIAEFNQMLQQKYGFQCVYYAHAGAGEIHLRPILNLKTSAGHQQFRSLAEDVAGLVKKYRGSLSGEHGDGRLRAEFLERLVGPKNYALLKQVKEFWDPKGIFNPGKIVEAPPMHTQLRYLPNQPTLNVETVFDFSNEQGVVRAAELCSGSGDCRKTHLSGGTMCPSYMATRDEADTTRARANILRHVLTNPKETARPFNSEEIKQVMDLCLSCKGCKRECPSNVDMAKLKAEFLQGYYAANGVPRRAKLIASFSDNMKWASQASWLYNWLVSSPLTARLIKKLSGFSRQRSLPKLHATTLRSWFDTHHVHTNAGSRGSIFLFCDEFTNYYDVPIGVAAVELLERLGFAVKIPTHEESGRSAISKGLLRRAKKIADANVKLLSPVVGEQSPLIGIEPSTILGFRDEYPSLVSPELRETANRLAKNCLMFDEFIAEMIDDDRVTSTRFTETKQTIRLHGHCHQKALASLAPTVRMLQLPKNYSVRLIPSGCCGMAGSFGYEQEHYDLSMQIGELVLFPTIRNESTDVLIAAPGTSCRHQILDGTGRKAYHPAEILRQALVED